MREPGRSVQSIAREIPELRSAPSAWRSHDGQILQGSLVRLRAHVGPFYYDDAQTFRGP